MKSKHTILLLSLILVSANISAQFHRIWPKYKNLISDEELHIVLTGDQKYDSTFRKIAEEELTFCQLTFLSSEDFYAKHTGNEPVYALEIGRTRDLWSGGGIKEIYDLSGNRYIGVFRYRADIKRPSWAGDKPLRAHRMPKMIVGYILNYLDYDVSDSKALIRLYLRNLNNDVHKKSKQRKRRKGLKSKKILLSKAAYYSDAEDLSRVYSFDIDIVSQERIAKAIYEREDVVIAVPAALKLRSPVFTLNSSEYISYAYIHYFFSARTGMLIDMTFKKFRDDGGEGYPAKQKEAELYTLGLFSLHAR